MVTSYIFFLKRTGFLALVTISSGLFNILPLYLLIDDFDLRGAAYAFCNVMATRFLPTFFVAQKGLPMIRFTFNTLFVRNKV